MTFCCESTRLQRKLRQFRRSEVDRHSRINRHDKVNLGPMGTGRIPDQGSPAAMDPPRPIRFIPQGDPTSG